jgi:NDP-sugar pyrophosphorylase family protein
MKAMLLAAGLGTRMRPLTLIRAKPALPVLNRPLLQWSLEALAHAGVTEVMVNLHYLPGSVKRAVGRSPFGLKVAYSHERRILGTAGGPRRVRAFFGRDPFLLVNGDVLFGFDLRKLLAAHRRSGAAVSLALLPNPDPRRYGSVVTGPDGRVRSLAGLPRPARGAQSLFTGIHVIDPVLLDRLPPGPSDSVRDLYAPMVAAGEHVNGVRVKGAWYDLGSPSLYLASHRSMLARGFRDVRRGSLVHPTAHVHPDAVVARSAIGAGARVEAGAQVRGSVLWDGVRVGAGAEVVDSVVTDRRTIGAGRRVRETLVLPRDTQPVEVEE